MSYTASFTCIHMVLILDGNYRCASKEQSLLFDLYKAFE